MKHWVVMLFVNGGARISPLADWIVPAWLSAMKVKEPKPHSARMVEARKFHAYTDNLVGALVLAREASRKHHPTEKIR